MQNFTSIFNIILNDVAEPWQLGFQDSAAPGYTGLVTLHNTIGFYLIVISFSVFWVLFSLIYYYSSNKNPIAHKYLTHGTLLELVWTITPALILIAIAFPSFRLLYLMDNPGLYSETLGSLTALATIPVSKIVSRSAEIVPLGVTGASNNIRLNKHSRDITVFNNELLSQLVGHLLGDGSIHYARTSVTPYFVFTQTIKRFEYTWHVYLTLSPYCGESL
jgi:heme/copper-type cytochrome/quinol oxidase subunit 2